MNPRTLPVPPGPRVSLGSRIGGARQANWGFANFPDKLPFFSQKLPPYSRTRGLELSHSLSGRLERETVKYVYIWEGTLLKSDGGQQLGWICIKFGAAGWALDFFI